MEFNEGFADLGMSEPLLAAVAGAGYEAPTPIQQKAIPLVLRGVDLLGCAQTGTGKTASYALPIIDILSSGSSKPRMPRCLILAPTRELAQQIADNFVTYGANHSLRQALLIGGEGFTLQEAALGKDPDILIATPGRLIDMFERGKIMLGGVKVLVIDEADRMLDMGFIPDVERIVQTLPRIRQTLMFSATLGPEIKRLGKEFLINPKEVSVSPPATVAGTVSHAMILVDPEEKRVALRVLLRDEAVQSALIFCNRKKDVDIVCASLQRPRLRRPRAARRHGAVTAGPRRWRHSRAARSTSSSAATWPGAASISRPSPTSSTSTCPTIRRTTFIASAAPAGLAAKAGRSPWPRTRKPRRWTPSRRW